MSEKKRILILGSTGMLGSAVTKHFTSGGRTDEYIVYATKRREFSGTVPTAPNMKHISFDAEFDNLQELHTRGLGDCDYVINCIGVIKPFMKSDPVLARMVNSVFPWSLSKHFADKAKVIHITTDCVFHGDIGGYNETDRHDAGDDYGQSKSLGEPDNCMVIRTSIVGEELHKNVSLIEWAKRNAGKTVDGYRNQLWNGITTKKYAEVCDQIIKRELWAPELYHVFSDIVVSKCTLLEHINDAFKLNLNVTWRDIYPSCDRSLNTIKDLCGKLKIGTIEAQLNDL